MESDEENTVDTPVVLLQAVHRISTILERKSAKIKTKLEIDILGYL